MPSATGTSMPMRRWRSARQAPAKNGAAENSSTGRRQQPAAPVAAAAAGRAPARPARPRRPAWPASSPASRRSAATNRRHSHLRAARRGAQRARRGRRVGHGARSRRACTASTRRRRRGALRRPSARWRARGGADTARRSRRARRRSASSIVGGAGGAVHAVDAQRHLRDAAAGTRSASADQAGQLRRIVERSRNERVGRHAGTVEGPERPTLTPVKDPMRCGSLMRVNATQAGLPRLSG